jgi:hypothetical protein
MNFAVSAEPDEQVSGDRVADVIAVVPASQIMFDIVAAAPLVGKIAAPTPQSEKGFAALAGVTAIASIATMANVIYLFMSSSIS